MNQALDRALDRALAKDVAGAAAPPIGKPRFTRRRVLGNAAGLIGAALVATGGYAAAIEPQSLVVTRYAPKPRGWPAGRKLSITVIADLHAGGPDMRLPHIRRIVDTAIALKSDLVVMLGDYIARYRFAIERIPDPVWAAELARITAPLGVWAILGNHDWWYDLAGVRSALGGRAHSRAGKPGGDAWRRGRAILACRYRRSDRASPRPRPFPRRRRLAGDVGAGHDRRSGHPARPRAGYFCPHAVARRFDVRRPHPWRTDPDSRGLAVLRSVEIRRALRLRPRASRTTGT